MNYLLFPYRASERFRISLFKHQRINQTIEKDNKNNNSVNNKNNNIIINNDKKNNNDNNIKNNDYNSK